VVDFNKQPNAKDQASKGRNKFDEIAIIVGGSHANAVADKLTAAGHTIINLAKGGWTVSEKNVAETVDRLKKELELNPSAGVLVIMGLDNSVYFGSDRIGSRDAEA